MSMALAVAGCSGKDKPSAPTALIQGKISVYNESDVSIRLTEFTQKRGELEYNTILNTSVYPNQSRKLYNLLDGGDTDTFPGGDQVSVEFQARVSDPNNPEQPLFENTASLIINGNNTILVKNGGEYGVGPG